MSSLAVEIHGSGEPVVFVHGLGGSSNVFTPQVLTLSRFFSCIRLDLPGAGRSGHDGTISLDRLVLSVLEVMDATAGEAPVHLVAHSMGTLIAQHLALQAPERVRSLSLVGPISDVPAGARQALQARAARARRDGMAAVADDLLQTAISAESRAHRPEVAAFVRELLMGQDRDGYAMHCEALAQSEAADLRRIGQPVSLLSGDEDGTSPLPAVRALQAQLAQADLRILSRCGHWASLERPAEVTETLLEFLLRRG